jgi:hypothetical protein
VLCILVTANAQKQYFGKRPDGTWKYGLQFNRGRGYVLERLPENIKPSHQFGFKTKDSSRSEARYPNGDVIGQYSYTSDTGEHEVNYKAGANGYQVTGTKFTRKAPNSI